MSIKVNNIILNIDEPIEYMEKKVAKVLNIKEKDIKEMRILKESIDARKKNSIKFNYQVSVKCDNEEKIIKRINNNIASIKQDDYTPEFKLGNKKLSNRPIIIGMGPAGLFAGLLLAQNGFKPIIIERGEDIDNRSKTVEEFWNTGKLNTESNVQFGEGGAGTFSDGKLTTRSKDFRCDYIVDTFIKFGANEDIRYKGKPHVGTDVLKNVVKNIRNEIINLGGEIKFNSKLEDILMKENKVKAIVVNRETIPCEVLILAIGHSSRDTYEMLYRKGIFMSSKAFAIGVRVEHPQQMINENQYGQYANHPRLGSADYRLTYTDKVTGRGVYSFCMCPGGVVVAASSEEKSLVTNGMSYSMRDKENSNSAIVVSVGENDFEGKGPLSGIDFQRYYEKLAYNLGGGNHVAPIQLVGDFLDDRNSTKIGRVKPSFTRGYEFKELKNCLPSYVISSLKCGMKDFDKKIKGFASDDAIMIGVETRTSAPVRIDRNENLESISLNGLYPAGEGAGYAGGIISAGVDGIKIAEKIISQWRYE